MLRSALLLVGLLVIGCGKKNRDAEAPAAPPGPRVVAPPPQDSGADNAPGAMRPGEENGEGRGYPNRLLAKFWRAVRDDVVVSAEPFGSTDGERFMVMVWVKNRNKSKPLQFANWTQPGQVTLKDQTGKRYPLVPIPENLEQVMRKSKAPEPNSAYGSGPVTTDLKRFGLLEFDRAALTAEYLDLDLDGAPVGFADPILFRIPKDMMTQPKK